MMSSLMLGRLDFCDRLLKFCVDAQIQQSYEIKSWIKDIQTQTVLTFAAQPNHGGVSRGGRKLDASALSNRPGVRQSKQPKKDEKYTKKDICNQLDVGNRKENLAFIQQLFSSTKYLEQHVDGRSIMPVVRYVEKYLNQFQGCHIHVQGLVEACKEKYRPRKSRRAAVQARKQSASDLLQLSAPDDACFKALQLEHGASESGGHRSKRRAISGPLTSEENRSQACINIDDLSSAAKGKIEGKGKGKARAIANARQEDPISALNTLMSAPIGLRSPLRKKPSVVNCKVSVVMQALEVIDLHANCITDDGGMRYKEKPNLSVDQVDELCKAILRCVRAMQAIETPVFSTEKDLNKMGYTARQIAWICGEEVESKAGEQLALNEFVYQKMLALILFLGETHGRELENEELASAVEVGAIGMDELCKVALYPMMLGAVLSEKYQSYPFFTEKKLTDALRGHYAELVMEVISYLKSTRSSAGDTRQARRVGFASHLEGMGLPEVEIIATYEQCAFALCADPKSFLYKAAEELAAGKLRKANDCQASEAGESKSHGNAAYGSGAVVSDGRLMRSTHSSMMQAGGTANFPEDVFAGQQPGDASVHKGMNPMLAQNTQSLGMDVLLAATACTESIIQALGSTELVEFGAADIQAVLKSTASSAVSSPVASALQNDAFNDSGVGSVSPSFSSNAQSVESCDEAEASSLSSLVDLYKDNLIVVQNGESSIPVDAQRPRGCDPRLWSTLRSNNPEANGDALHGMALRRGMPPAVPGGSPDVAASAAAAGETTEGDATVQSDPTDSLLFGFTNLTI